MPNPNPLAGVIPQVIHPVKDDETQIVAYIEKVEGEVALDAYVKAQMSAPEIVKRITDLENCIQRMANAILAYTDALQQPDLHALAEQGTLLLKERLAVDDKKHRFRTKFGTMDIEPASTPEKPDPPNEDRKEPPLGQR
jgi:hypothetical protein